jgi:hypothetical protein
VDIKSYNLKYREDRSWTIIIVTTLPLIIFLFRGFSSDFSVIYGMVYAIGMVGWLVYDNNHSEGGPEPENSRKFNPAKRINFLQDMVDGTFYAPNLKYKPELDYLKEKYKSEIGDYAKLRKNYKEETQTSEAKRKRRSNQLIYGAHASEIACPHCNTKGKVRKKRKEITEESREKGIIGATIGRKTITKKGSVTQLHCDNCDVTWTV